jgi:hypothetical protein
VDKITKTRGMDSVVTPNHDGLRILDEGQCKQHNTVILHGALLEALAEQVADAVTDIGHKGRTGRVWQDHF